MEDKVISAFNELSLVAANDVLLINDVSDTSDGVNGTTKKVQQSNLVADRAPLASPIFTGTVTLPSGLIYSGVTIVITGTELNYLSGVTSGIQAQLAGKQPLDSDLTTIAGLVDPNADEILFWDDSASSYAYLSVGSGLQIVGTMLSAIGAGGGYTLLEKTSGSVDGTNATFGFSQQPLFAIRGGAHYRVNDGWTWDGAHVVFTIPPDANSDVYGLV